MNYLNGVSVLELGQHISASFCTKIMAALGAEVIKIEKVTGDPARREGPFPNDEPHPEKSGLFLYLNMGKKGVTLNINTKTGQKIFKELVARSNILVEDLGKNILKNIGLGYNELSKTNPRLVYTSVSPFGETGPHSDYKAEEIVLEATSGLMFTSGSPEREPLKMGGNIGYYRAGVSAFTASLMAFYQTQVFGEGQHVEVSIQECLLHDEAIGIDTYKTRGEVVSRQIAAMHLPATDGWYYIRAWPHEWPRFVEALGVPELKKDERFITIEERRKHAEELNPIIMSRLDGLTKEEIYHKMQKNRVTAAYLADIKDVTRSKQYISRGYFVPIEHPEAGYLRYPGAFATMDKSDWKHGRAPLLGEHNNEVYCRSLGYSSEDLVRLRELGVI